MRRRLIVVLSVLVVLTLVGAGLAFAQIAINTFETEGTVRASGHHAVVTPVIACHEGDFIRIRVTVTQEDENVNVAWGQGYTVTTCTGEEQHLPVHVLALEGTTFEEGHAEACALAVTRKLSGVTDVRQWCAGAGVQLVAAQ